MSEEKKARGRAGSRRRPRITQHARERAIERHDCGGLGDAQRHLDQCWRSSIRLPYRYARDLFHRAGPRKPELSRKREVRVAGSTLLICRGRKVLTTWRLTDDQVATVFWWTISNRWLS